MHSFMAGVHLVVILPWSSCNCMLFAFLSISYHSVWLSAFSVVLTSQRVNMSSNILGLYFYFLPYVSSLQVDILTIVLKKTKSLSRSLYAQLTNINNL